jgi:hypothetical protein
MKRNDVTYGKPFPGSVAFLEFREYRDKGGKV